MKQVSPLLATKLARKQLIRTECWRDLGASGNIEVAVEQRLEFVPQDKNKGASYDFYIDFTTHLIGKLENKEVIKIESTFRGDYNISDQNVTIENLHERSFEFAEPFFLSSRDHVAYLLTQMGLSSAFLPFSMREGETYQVSDKKVKSGAPASKRNTRSKS